ncbi:hypothetical protein BV902_09550 [Sphingobacterium sp. B29]|uniref:hypothetical protein n=1 Tax=Sphingobacterium sp. B29 TaxID=1933220 RepID=UPI000957D5A1|nr:hypothetical protein [Sphingobacterium sp. B29]APU96565.1 hypothetical protein BV902_09550 [Sphingobacterium sp. B29]
MTAIEHETLIFDKLKSVVNQKEFIETLENQLILINSTKDAVTQISNLGNEVINDLENKLEKKTSAKEIAKEVYNELFINNTKVRAENLGQSEKEIKFNLKLQKQYAKKSGLKF